MLLFFFLNSLSLSFGWRKSRSYRKRKNSIFYSFFFSVSFLFQRRRFFNFESIRNCWRIRFHNIYGLSANLFLFLSERKLKSYNEQSNYYFIFEIYSHILLFF